MTRASAAQDRRTVTLLSLAVILGALLLGGLAVGWWAPGPHREELRIIVPRGAGTGQIGAELASRGALRSAFVFRLGFRLMHGRTKLRFGEFAIPPRASAAAIARILARARPVLRFVTIPEGWTSREIVARLERTEGLVGPVSEVPPEGSLLPDTYAWTWGETRVALLARMRTAMERFLTQAWAGRDPGIPLATAEEAVILASIVELESHDPADRRMVAAVLLNRLKAGMRLEADPTAVYGSEPGPAARARPPTGAELKADNPYNTYRRRGLPPAPIANPGRDAILAVLHPAKTDALYFVADGCGTHRFARTLAEHRRNVRLWRRGAVAAGCGPKAGTPPAEGRS
ncbi:MAG: aminodeoxychorismate lyase [Rhodothalassiaceae bacterium]|nr:MAG: aminodeoxychorismate lyase [Rhodothalassiaceae bacterium]